MPMMTIAVDDSRSRILTAAAQCGHGRGGQSLERLLHRFFRHVATEELGSRRPDDLLGMVLSHQDFATHRKLGEPKVRVFTPTVDSHGWSVGHTVIEIVTDDMPFLVDSVSAELGRQDRMIHSYIHPQLLVRRDADGALLEVLDIDETAGDVPEGATPESWMHIEIDRESDQEDREAIIANLLSVLADVRIAVTDWAPMNAKAAELARELETNPPVGIDADQLDSAVELLKWMVDGQFTFLSYRQYEFTTPERDTIAGLTDTGLGFMRPTHLGSQYGTETKLPANALEMAREKRLLTITKANSLSTVHRKAYLDYIGIKTFDSAGEVVGEHRFLGLFTSSAYTWSVTRIPVVKEKVAEVIRRSGFAPDSHSGKDLLGVLENYPRDELFQADVDTLLETAKSVVILRERRQTRLFLRRDDYGRFVSCLVYLPRDRYTTPVRRRLEALLREAFSGTEVEYTTRVTESALARLYFVVRVAPGETIPEVDVEELQARLVESTRSWEDELAEAVRTDHGEEDGATLLSTYGRGFPEAYKEDFGARVGSADLKRVQSLAGAQSLDLNLYRDPTSPADERRLKVYRNEPLTLTDILPVFTHLGVKVTDERPYEIEDRHGAKSYIYDFGMRTSTDEMWDGGRGDTRERFQECFTAVWEGLAESDGFNALVLRAGLTWRQIVMLRAVAKYMRQTGSTFSQTYIEDTLVAHPSISRLLVELFEARFDPSGPWGVENSPERAAAEADIVATITQELDAVASLDHDRILRDYLTIIQATLRTNFYQEPRPGADGVVAPYKPTVCFKLDPKAIPTLPAPRPMFEIWVYSPRVEGVHLRFGKVARGGLRWSDRREDFRTEILGLVKAQMVKNAVIVPTGSKGGFFAKQLPDPAMDREAWMAEGIESYKLFISSLLDVTDNLIAGEVIPPQRVVRHDPDDTYLVVAADKGTAKFSDIANSVAQDYGFWLDDAFASGGSAGYDHKGMGITARGAWESVKRHFRERGVDTQTQDFTCVGVGDMSGDVFGNGMLLSEHIRLVAAFDHRDIFVDPTPDSASSYQERKRLFDLPRSSWADYDATKISAGGGVFSRSAKSIPLNTEMRTALGIDESVESMTPAELMKAILLSPVDLLWNGGIGTYVKASFESNAEIGDRANDAIRVNGKDLRVAVVGEGGNLGCSQNGRIEAALSGVQINTDAIDNSAGVDTSDHEVNIKILLTSLMREGDMTLKQRNEVLESMTDEVGLRVLRDNYEQNVLLGNAREHQHEMLGVHTRFMHWLEKRGDLDRALEFLPSDAVIARRKSEGVGLTSPEFSVLVAYAKLALKDDLVHSTLPDEEWFKTQLADYFPTTIQERFSGELASHPLKREIIVNSVANSLVNRGGITFAYRSMEETGASQADIARAFIVCREVFDLRSFVEGVEALDNKVDTDVQTELYIEFRRLLDRAVRWFLTNRPVGLEVGSAIERYRPAVVAVAPRMEELLRGIERERLLTRCRGFVERGVPEDLAMRAAALLDTFSCLDIVELSTETGASVDEIAPLYFAVSEHFNIDVMLNQVGVLPREDRWDALARGAMRDDLYAVLEGLTRVVLESTDDSKTTDERFETWTAENAEGLDRSAQSLSDIHRLDQVGIAPLSVALRTLRGIVRTGSAPA